MLRLPLLCQVLTIRERRRFESLDSPKHPVDTISGHVSLDTHLELMKWRSAGGAMVTSLQGSCRWRLMPMGKQPIMTKSRSSDAFMPMASADGCQWEWWCVNADGQCWWLPIAVKGGLPMILKRIVGVADWLVAVCRSITEDSLIFSLVIRVYFVYGFRLIWNLSSSRV